MYVRDNLTDNATPVVPSESPGAFFMEGSEMALSAADIDIEERKRAGRDAAIAANATEHKPTGQTSEEVYPFTYWWVVGYNEQVDTGQ